MQNLFFGIFDLLSANSTSTHKQFSLEDSLLSDFIEFLKWSQLSRSSKWISNGSLYPKPQEIKGSFHSNICRRRTHVSGGGPEWIECLFVEHPRPRSITLTLTRIITSHSVSSTSYHSFNCACFFHLDYRPKDHGLSWDPQPLQDHSRNSSLYINYISF